MYSRRLVCTLCLCALVSPAAFAQIEETTFSFLQQHSQPRIHALGEATVALRGYPGAVDINPATIGEPGTVRVGSDVLGDAVFASAWLPNLFPERLWLTTPSLSVKQGRWAGAAQLKYFDLGEEERRDANGNVVSTTQSQEWSAMAAVAYDLTPRLTVGGGTQLLRSERLPDARLASSSITTVALDLGLHYRRSFRVESLHIRPSLGWSLNNFGPTVDYEPDEPGDQALPVKMRVGGAVAVESARAWMGRALVRATLTGQLSKVFANTEEKQTSDDQVYTDADGPFRALFASGWGTAPGERRASGERPRLSVWEQTIKHAGAEVRVADILALRWGRFHENEFNGGRQFTTYGFGVDLYYVEVDHSWTAGDGALNHSFWRLTARIPFNGEAPQNFWPEILN